MKSDPFPPFYCRCQSEVTLHLTARSERWLFVPQSKLNGREKREISAKKKKSSTFMALFTSEYTQSFSPKRNPVSSLTKFSFIPLQEQSTPKQYLQFDQHSSPLDNNAVAVDFSPIDSYGHSSYNGDSTSVSCSSCGEVHGDTYHLWQMRNGGRANMSPSEAAGTRRKLLVLLVVATLALTSMVVIGERLVRRHLQSKHQQREHLQQHELIEVDIITLDEWVERQSAEMPKVEKHSEQDLSELRSDVDGTKILEDGVFWSREIEAMVWPGPDEDQIQDQVQRLRDSKVASSEEPAWNRCGREPNRFVTFFGGSSACARNRAVSGMSEEKRRESERFPRGEVLAFYLARLLGMRNVPAVALSKVRFFLLLFLLLLN